MLFNSAKNQYRKVTVDGIEMEFKKLTFNEVKLCEEQAKTMNEEVPKLFWYIVSNFVRDVDKNPVCTEEDVSEIGIEFQSLLVKKFFSVISVSLSEDEIKKN